MRIASTTRRAPDCSIPLAPDAADWSEQIRSGRRTVAGIHAVTDQPRVDRNTFESRFVNGRRATGSVPAVVTDPERSWWEDYNDRILSARETGWVKNELLLSREMCELLDDVDAAFAVTGVQTPGWPNPNKDGLEPGEEAYERSTNPEKFLIVVARARAWTKVLLDRGWARESSNVDWALRPIEAGGADTVLGPIAIGAVPLVLTTHTPTDSDHPFNITIAAGYPAVRLASIPDCACDGCDSGSADLVKDMDMWVLSVVDGSLEVDVAVDHYSVRTSFRAEGGTVQNLNEPAEFTAAPWPAGWTARPPVPDIETPRKGLTFPRSVIARTVIGNVARAALHGLLRKPGPMNRTQTYRSK